MMHVLKYKLQLWENENCFLPTQQILPADCPEVTPSCSQQQSPELMVFLKKRLTIRTKVLNNVHYDLAHEAYAKGLISKGVLRTVTDSRNNLTGDARTDLFLDELESSIRTDPTALTQFLSVLGESDAAYYAILIRNISEFCPWFQCLIYRIGVEEAGSRLVGHYLILYQWQYYYIHVLLLVKADQREHMPLVLDDVQRMYYITAAIYFVVTQ